MQLCGPGGRVLVTILQRRGSTRAASTRALDTAEGCASYRLTWRLAERFRGAGRYTVTVRAARG